MIDRETAAEMIDDARREAERAAATEIAELRAGRDDLAQQLAELEPMRALWDALRLSTSTPLVQADAARFGCVRIVLYVDSPCGDPVLAALKAIALKIDSLLPVEVTQ